MNSNNKLTFDNIGMAPVKSKTSKSWSNLNDDLLLRVMMQLSIMDYFAFSSTCKVWRSFARSNKKDFMCSSLPLEIYCDTNHFCLRDYERREFKAVVPHSTGRLYVGCTCGYFILLGTATRDLWLVNPITRKELHFDDFPVCFDGFPRFDDPLQVRALLVYSPLMSQWVYVHSVRKSYKIVFCSPGTGGCWDSLISDSAIDNSIDDIHYFQGKIYIIYGGGSRLYEMRLHPYPDLNVLEMKNSPKPVVFSEFVRSGENLYVLGYNRTGPCRVLKLDFDEMEWVSAEKTTIDGYALSLCELKSGMSIRPGTWADSAIEYKRPVLFPSNRSLLNRPFNSSKWYFLNECYDDNRLRE